MSLPYNTRQKIRNIQRTIDALLDGDFPINSGKRALEKLRAAFSELDNKMQRAIRINEDSSQRLVANDVNLKILETLPILGFILRSTNVRNSFEFLDPLQIIADKILQDKPEVLLSSEWDYVPFAFPQSLDDLLSFVLIGMPASESGNALLLPLAGHELGHAVWRNLGIGESTHPKLQDTCIDLYTKHHSGEFYKIFKSDAGDLLQKDAMTTAIGESVEFSLYHAEELFCDLFAYALFGESYIYAFAYILAPGTTRPQGFKHPSFKTR